MESRALQTASCKESASSAFANSEGQFAYRTTQVACYPADCSVGCDAYGISENIVAKPAQRLGRGLHVHSCHVVEDGEHSITQLLHVVILLCGEGLDRAAKGVAHHLVALSRDTG